MFIPEQHSRLGRTNNKSDRAGSGKFKAMMMIITRRFHMYAIPDTGMHSPEASQPLQFRLSERPQPDIPHPSQTEPG